MLLKVCSCPGTLGSGTYLSETGREVDLAKVMRYVRNHWIAKRCAEIFDGYEEVEDIGFWATGRTCDYTHVESPSPSPSAAKMARHLSDCISKAVIWQIMAAEMEDARKCLAKMKAGRLSVARFIEQHGPLFDHLEETAIFSLLDASREEMIEALEDHVNWLRELQDE